MMETDTRGSSSSPHQHTLTHCASPLPRWPRTPVTESHCSGVVRTVSAHTDSQNGRRIASSASDLHHRPLRPVRWDVRTLWHHSTHCDITAPTVTSQHTLWHHSTHHDITTRTGRLFVSSWSSWDVTGLFTSTGNMTRTTLTEFLHLFHKGSNLIQILSILINLRFL